MSPELTSVELLCAAESCACDLGNVAEAKQGNNRKKITDPQAF